MDLIYPHVCGICGKLDKNSLCNKCKLVLQNQAIFKTEDYTETSSFFDEHIYMFQYRGEIRNAILNYKFKEKSYLYETFAKFLKKNQKKCVQIKKYDIIMPIPISKKRLKLRGYNQSGIFAKELANIFQIKYNENILIKIKDNVRQSELSKEERIENVKNVYKVQNSEEIYNKKILLVDDIFTTGNTANECSKILIENSAKKVGIFTIAKD